MLEAFDHFWKLLALHNHCDEFGSAEYHRVRETFVQGGCAVALTRFICREANRDASVSQISEDVQRVLNNSLTVANEEIVRVKKREEQIVRALRALVDALPANQEASLIYFAGTPLAKACRESVELLRIIDAQKE